MKKSLLLVLAVPALLLASCGGGGVDVKGTVDNGKAIIDADKQAVAAVTEEKKEAMEEIVNKGVKIQAKNYFNQKLESREGNSETTADVNMDMEIGVTNPSIYVKSNGSAYANGYGQSGSGSVEGLSEAKVVDGAWVITNDYQITKVNGVENKQENVLFQGSASGAEAYYDGIVDGLFSWDFDFDFSKAQAMAQQYGFGDFLSKIVIAGDPSTGTFELGLGEVYTYQSVGGYLKFAKLRYAFEDYLLKEYSLRMEASMADASYGYSTAVVYEMDFVFTYTK